MIQRKWAFHTAALGVLLLAFGLSLGGLTLEGIWWDEVWTWEYSKGHFLDVIGSTAYDVHPPLYYMLMWVWIHYTGDESIWVMRLSSVLTGLLAVAGVYRLGWAWFRRGWVALAAAGWLGTNSVFIYQQRDIRMYPLVVLLAVVSWWALWRLLERRRGGVALYTVSVALMAYTYYFTVFVVLAQVLYVVCVRPKQLARYVVASLLALVLFAPWLPTAYNQIRQEAAITEGAVAVPGLGAVGKAYTARTTDIGMLTEFLSLYSAEQTLLLLGLVALGGGVGLMVARREALAVLAWGVGTAAIFLGLNVFVPLFAPRYTIMMLPGTALLVGLVALAAAPRYRGGVVALLLAGGVISHNHAYAYLPERDPHRDILNAIMPNLQPDDKIWYAFTFGALGSATYGEMNYYSNVTYPELTENRFVWDARTELTDAEAVPRVWDVRYLYNPMPPEVEALITAERSLAWAARYGEYMVRLYTAQPERPPVTFGDQFEVLPFHVPAVAAPGESVAVSVLMRPTMAPTLNYSYGLQLRQGGQVVVQADAELMYHTLDVSPEALGAATAATPTSMWGVWDDFRVVQPTVTLPPDATPGDYEVYLTLYYWEEPAGMPLIAPDETRTDGDWLRVGALAVGS